ncbi:MAG: DNA primase [Jhaorihella sp.]
MSLPPGFLDELRSRSSLSQVVGRKVVWDARKSNQGKGDMWAPCPFHQEKTASFHVDDRKGFYYCFGCHAKGDAIGFIRETENVGFMEAVEILAREVGMAMPERDPRSQEKSDRRTLLAGVMEQAAQFFRLRLSSGAGGAARDYLARRGLSDGALERWEIGFAPDGWQGLWDHLRGKGVAEDLILGAGLAKPSARGGKPYDVFRNRIMFPIRDPRGRCIAFGGRAMDPKEPAKYLNSPETELFDKGRTLFNLGPAREAAGKGKPLIVAEGYMDVIALAEAGFAAAVAPLGTAVTETQLRMLWRVAPEPVIALDGDRAGLGAAMRLMDLALPLLEAGQSLRFALMPEGKDPDDVIRAGGPGAMQQVLDAAMPMVQLLWRRETEGRDFDSPERKAALDKALRERIRLIRDASIRSHYGAEIKDLRWQLFRPKRGPAIAGGRGRTAGVQRRAEPWHVSRSPVATSKSSVLGTPGPSQVEDAMTHDVICATLLLVPGLRDEFAAQLERLEPRDAETSAIFQSVLTCPASDPAAVRQAAIETVGAAALERLFARKHVKGAPPVFKNGDPEAARLQMRSALEVLASTAGLRAEIAEAVEDISGIADESVTWRLHQAAEARNRAERSHQEDTEEYDLGENGARINRAERNRLDALVQQIRHRKPGQ